MGKKQFSFATVFLLILICVLPCKCRNTPKVQPNQTDIPKIKSPEVDKSTNKLSKKKTRTITIVNNIVPKMLKYKHWTGSYKPSIFEIKFNDQKIDMGTKQEIQIIDNQLFVRFDYSFMNGMRKGAKVITLLIDEKADTANITFSWTDKWHILCDEAKPTSIKELEFSK